MDFRILGPLDVRSSEGVPVKIPRPQHRALLCFLLLHAGEVVTRATVYEALWGASLPQDPATSLRSCIYGLRKAIGDGSRLLTRDARYRFELADGDYLDLLIFRRLVEDGRRALTVGDYSHAVKLLGDALGLWQEPALADFPDPALAFGGAAALLQERAIVQEALADARLALGDHHGLTVWLRELTAAEPFRERRWEQLMLAQYRSGMQADALASYLQVRNILRDECGIEPGPGLRQLHQWILACNPALAWNPPAAVIDGTERSETGPDSVVSDIQAVPEENGVDGPAGPSRAATRMLPHAPKKFVGRRAEVEILGRLADQADNEPDGVVVAISGPTGIGKSALAIHWVNHVADRFPDGQLYVDMRHRDSGTSPMSPSAVIGKFLGALGVAGEKIPGSMNLRADLYRSLLRGKRLLVVLDNAPDSDSVRALLPETAHCMVVITGGQGLADLVVSSAAHLISLDVLTHAEARDLLAVCLGARRVATELQAADALIEFCGRVPLALTAAAMRNDDQSDSPIAGLFAELCRSQVIDTFDSNGQAVVIVRGGP